MGEEGIEHITVEFEEVEHDEEDRKPLASSLGRSVCTELKKIKGLASHPWAVILVTQTPDQLLGLRWGCG